ASPRPIGWAAHTEDIEAIRRRAAAAGLKFTGPTAGSRKRPDGRMLHWTTLNIEDATGLLPFFIHWSADSLHPSADSPQGCALEVIQFRAPNADNLRRTLQALAIRADIQQASAPAIHIAFSTPKGKLELS